MNRSAREVDRAIFSRIEDYSTARGQAPFVVGARWLQGDDADLAFVVKTPVSRVIRFSRHRALALLEHSGTTHLGLIGFDFDGWPLSAAEVEAEEVASGQLSLLLFECDVSPVAHGAVVADIGGAASNLDADYQGHDHRQVARLFPRVRLIDLGASMSEQEVWPVALRICAQECEEGASWIEQSLARDLQRLAELALPELPYESLCRSIFDLDPRSLFLAIYRLIEAAYAFGASHRLASELGVPSPWFQIAESLDKILGWRPRHGDALNELLRESSVPDSDLQAICAAAHVTVGDDLPASAGKAIRDLRNRIVHYGPSMTSVRIEDYDWNALCVALLTLSGHVFRHAYLPSAPVAGREATDRLPPSPPSAVPKWITAFFTWFESRRQRSRASQTA